MNKNELLRALNAHLPEVVEKSITLWGKAELDAYLLDVIAAQSIRPAGGVAPEVLHALDDLKALHDSEFPQFVCSERLASLEKLGQNPEFVLIREQFPHVGRRLSAVWGTASFRAYMDSLCSDDRTANGGHRRGFPEPVAVALFRLNQLHDQEFERFVSKASDIWTLNNRI